MSTSDQTTSTDHLVIVGSSAGGIEALSILVSTLPADFPAPIVLAQHLDPKRHSNLDYLQSTPSESEELIKAVLITDTAFFHGSLAFEYLKNTVLPELPEGARDRDYTLRCWSAGCATGEEVYSLAMLLADLLGSEISRWNIKLFATDLSEEAISFARRGVYAENNRISPGARRSRRSIWCCAATC